MHMDNIRLELNYLFLNKFPRIRIRVKYSGKKINLKCRRRFRNLLRKRDMQLRNLPKNSSQDPIGDPALLIKIRQLQGNLGNTILVNAQGIGYC